MRTCAVAVIGLGLMGSAALHALLRRGVDALGFDPLPLGAATGSSHGSCRVFRRFNAENPAYTALSDQALAGWRALEAQCGEPIVLSSPVLEAGPPGDVFVAKSRAAAAAVGLVSGPRTGREANILYPAFNLPEDWDVVVQDGGGILLTAAAMRAFRADAAGRIVQETARFEAGAGGIVVTAGDAQVLAERVIVAVGPWIAGLIPDLAPHLSVTRQTVGWFAPAQPQTVALGAFPVFLIGGPHGFVYGFPDFEGHGVKAAGHDPGPAVGPDDWGPPASDSELSPIRLTLEALIPGAAGPIVDRDVCLYTNTAKADVRVDDGEEFIIDRLPADPRIIVASPCSGHGAKFASAIGEMLARLATDPGFEVEPAFRLDRFSSFAETAT
jgi:sarcosine oxidase